MAITPEKASVDNDKHIMEQVVRLEKIIDGELARRWHSKATMVVVTAPEVKSPWKAEIIAILSNRYTEAGWKIERQHEPAERWTFKRAK